MSIVAGLFDTSGFPPRWHCGAWPPALGWTHIVSDLAIFAAYTAIPLSLGVFLVRRRNVPFSFVFWLFVAFILSCGLTHLIEAIIFYKPVYRLAGVVKAVTAAVSIATVIALVRVMPAALRMPDIKAAHDQMAVEIQERQRVQEELERARIALEGRSGALTLHSHRVESAMEATWVMACQWEADTGLIVWEIGGRRWARELEIPLPRGQVTGWSMLLSDDDLQGLIGASRAAVREDREIEFMCAARSDTGHRLQIRLTGSPDRRVSGAPATLTGMARLI